MLKQGLKRLGVIAEDPAAFRRLCVETVFEIDLCQPTFPAAFRRLCVETSKATKNHTK